MEDMMEVLVVLVPMTLVGVVGFVALELRIRSIVGALLRTGEHLEMLRDVVVALMFVGPGLGLVFGIDEKSPKSFAYIVAVAGFVLFGWVALQLNRLLQDLRIEQEVRGRRRQAQKARLSRRQGIVSKKRKIHLK